MFLEVILILNFNYFFHFFSFFTKYGKFGLCDIKLLFFCKIINLEYKMNKRIRNNVLK